MPVCASIVYAKAATALMLIYDYDMEYKDYYKILGVSRDAKLDEIKRSYRRLARKYHPDVSKEPDAEKRIKEINEAYEVLKDSEKKSAYDRLGSNWQNGQDFKPPPEWGSTAHYGDGGFSGPGGGNFSDFFEGLFGGGMGGFTSASRGSPFSGFTQGSGHQYAKLSISLEDAFHGVTRQISLSIPKMDAQGHIVNTKKTLKVKIPSGIQEGQQLRLASHGSKAQGGQTGDLFLEINIEPHRIYTLQGKDVYLKIPITPWEAGLGAQIPVPTLAGKVDLKIQPGTQTGQKLRLKGRGLPGRTPGDQYVILKVVIPKAETQKAKEIYREMEREMKFNPRSNM